VNIGFIPMRTGSKRITHKNVQMFRGKYLYKWAISAALASKLDKVVLFTNYDIKNKYYKLSIVPRPEWTETDEATTEDAMLYYIEKHDVDTKDRLFLIQATNPFIKSTDINNAIEHLDYFDSVLSVVEDRHFRWQANGTPLNYDPQHRQMSQNVEPEYIENGAIYGSRVTHILVSKCRISGDVGFTTMPWYTLHEIDTIAEFKRAEKLHALYMR
jgi:N-acylneuraminate cytidylyltransferase